MSIDDLPDNFSGVEGQEEKTHLFFLVGEIEITGEGLEDEEALEDLKDMTIREALQKGLHLE